MYQLTIRYFCIFLAIILFTLLSCPGELITETDIILLEDAIPPKIRVYTPENNGFYDRDVLVEGNITDLADSEGTPGRVKSFIYKVKDQKGDIPFDKHGFFTFIFHAGNFDGQIILKFIGTDWNNNRAIKQITLNKNAFPELTCSLGNMEITLDNINPDTSYDSYTIYYSVDGFLPSDLNGIAIENIPSDISFYTIPNLTNGVLYIVQINGIIDGEVADSSRYKSAIPLSPFTLAPRVKGEYGKIHLSWTGVPGADQYYVLRSTSKTGEFITITENVDESEYTDTGVIQGQPYYYKVKPFLQDPDPTSQGLSIPCLESEAVYGETAPFPDLASRIGSCQTGDFTNSIAVKGSYAYIANHDNGLAVINIADPSDPRLVRNWGLPEGKGNAYDVCIMGEYAYVAADDGGLYILDISTPGDPELKWEYETLDYALAVDVEESYAYVAIENTGLEIVDISNPAVPPHQAGFYDIGETGLGITVEGDYAYVACGASGLVVINISPPGPPGVAGFYDTPGSAYDVVVDGTLAYVADDGSDLQILDISNLSSITNVGSVDPAIFKSDPGGARGIAVSGIYVYLAYTDAGLVVLNISNHDKIKMADAYPPVPNPSDPNSPIPANGVTIMGEYGFVAGNKGFHVISIAEPTPAETSSTGSTTGSAMGVAVDGEYAYVAASDQGIVIFDITSPENPVLTNVIPMAGGEAQDITICGRYCFITGYDTGLVILDIFNPVSIFHYKTIDMPAGTTTTGAELRGDFLYVSYWIGTAETGIKVYNIAKPVETAETAVYPLEGTTRDIAIYGDYAYVASDNRGMQILHLKDQPPDPAPFGTENDAKGVTVWKKRAFVAIGSSGIELVDISTPLFPQPLGIYDTPGFAYNCDNYGRYLFIADGQGGLQIVDLVDKKQPDPLSAGSYTVAGVHGIVVRGKYAYLGAGNEGLKIIDLWRFDNS